MENKLSDSQLFFKVMRPGYDIKLPLPQAFCSKLKGNYSEMATLTSCKGTSEVKVDECSNGLICFASGWDSFVREHDLRIENFVVFEHTGRMHFTVSLFDSTGCEKDFPADLSHKRPDEFSGVGIGQRGEIKHVKKVEEPIATSAPDHPDSFQFTKTMRACNVTHHSTFLYFPVTFWRSHHLGRTKWITLVDSTGKRWPVKVTHSTHKRVSVRKGWSDFCRSNDLKVGDVCVFHLRRAADGCGGPVMMDVRVSKCQHLSGYPCSRL